MTRAARMIGGGYPAYGGGVRVSKVSKGYPA